LGGQSAGTLAASELGAEGIQPRAPVPAELIQPAIHFLQRGGIDGIKPSGPFGAYGGETGLSEHPQMLGHRRLAYPKLCGDRIHHSASRMLARCDELKDPTTDGITQDVKRVHGQTLSIGTYISQELFIALDDRGFPVSRSHGNVAGPY
jgi:hypothetical protein